MFHSAQVSHHTLQLTLKIPIHNFTWALHNYGAVPVNLPARPYRSYANVAVAPGGGQSTSPVSAPVASTLTLSPRLVTLPTCLTKASYPG